METDGNVQSGQPSFFLQTQYFYRTNIDKKIRQIPTDKAYDLLYVFYKAIFFSSSATSNKKMGGEGIVLLLLCGTFNFHLLGHGLSNLLIQIVW